MHDPRRVAVATRSTELSGSAGREVILIAAVGPNMVIGDGLKLPWSLPRDMRLFRRLTISHPVVMGRKTFESLGRRPLPRRRNIVVSRNPGYIARGCEVAHSIGEAIELTPPGSRVFVIGGGSVYQQAMPFATALLVTEIFDESPNKNLFQPFTGDVFFPVIDPALWDETLAIGRSYIAASRIPGYSSVKRKGLRFRVRRFVRKGSSVDPQARLRVGEVGTHLTVPKSVIAPQEDLEQSDLFGDPPQSQAGDSTVLSD